MDTTTTNYVKEDDPRVLEVGGSMYDVIDINKRHLHIRTPNTNQNIHLSYKHKEDFDQYVEDGSIVGRKDYHLSPSNACTTTKYIVITSDVYQINPRQDNRMILSRFSDQTIDEFAMSRRSPIEILAY